MSSSAARIAMLLAATRTLDALCPDCLDRAFRVSYVAEILQFDGSREFAQILTLGVALRDGF
jgi:hypothetical protein